ncbi:MAG: DUF4038 domain-containing protein [Alphaproteobacteria bacterium]|nr:DUF4038 domain-containing protein [Alphaproteobacteria bacterium]MDE2499680.1 DUF4038 domain-containing protein [Alphaproteobacteria bacterium]
MPAVPRFLSRAVGIVLLALSVFIFPARAELTSGEAHVWSMQEIILQAQHDYANPYTQVQCWIDLKGPGFDKRVYGFWDGGHTFKIRFVATAPGDWTWTTGSNQPDDPGLNGGTGALRAVAWTPAEIKDNPNRRGFVHPAGHVLEYADGTPFFLLGDTWLAASTWRLPWRGGAEPPADYVPGPGISFEDAVAYRKQQGFNSISFISAFPNWAADSHGATYKNKDGVYLRNAWEKFGVWAPGAKISTADGATTTAKDMQDEHGNLSFAIFPDRDGLPDYDHINPAYFQSLDHKMDYLSQQGFVPVFEPVRRDTGPAWKAYFDFNASYARYVEYLAARYGAYNMIFSGIHLDWIPKDYSLTADEYNAALNNWLKSYGPLPFGQPVTSLIDSSTYLRFGDRTKSPWLTMQSVGNNPRNHGIYPMIEQIFRLDPPYPVANLEPYYSGWNHAINRPGGETPPPGSPRDTYFARAMMYGSVLSGALAGHVYGTGAYDVTTTGEAEGWRPYIWQALRYPAGGQLQYLRDFMLSDGSRYEQLTLASDDLHPRIGPKAVADGLDGWSYMMRTPDRHLALLYFEFHSVRPQLTGFSPNVHYRWSWYDPRDGHWVPAIDIEADGQGTLLAPLFPDAQTQATLDWAAKITAR